ncbi:MFS transporter [Kitasatospora kifunensis]|uniref:Putative MFS transporter n=1 Tax=Kitasatospora kifunensis TaxID=58351 RepID=A0A7W7VSV2_KITKI|nr:MFS transporter [Kitasatospora kifunensis]MBB4921029.1 putative MFS transporter [Kitasatospora kifunensis]
MPTPVTTSRVSARTVRRLAPPLVAFGEFVDGYDLLVMSCALVFLTPAFALTALDKGVLGAASFVGAAVGALVFGDLTDRFGRRAIFVLNLVLFVVSALASAFVSNVPELVVARLLVGIGVGMDIPTSSSFLAEVAPRGRRGRISGSLPNAMWLLGAITSAGVAIALQGHADGWRWLFGLAAVPALLVLAARQLLPESPRWLQSQGREAEARALYADLGLEPPAHVAPAGADGAARGYRALFGRRYRTRTLAFALFFAANGLGGGVSTIAGPLFLAAAGLDKSQTMQFTLYGFLVGLAAVLLGALLIDRINRRWFGVATALGALVFTQLLAWGGKENHTLVFTCWLAFTFFTWIGPGTLAWVWSAELFPTALRGVGVGFTQAAGRLAIAVTAGFGPTVISAWSLHAVALFSAAYLVCALVLLAFPFFATTGADLEESATEAPVAGQLGGTAELATPQVLTDVGAVLPSVFGRDVLPDGGSGS